MKEILKRNWMFFLLFLVFVICLLSKDTYLPTALTSDTDTWFVLKQGEILEQNWIANGKEIVEVTVNTKSEKSFASKVGMNIFEGGSGKKLISIEEEFNFSKDIEKELIFHFPSLQVEAGKQYIIQLVFLPENSKDTIMIAADSDYMGCMIDGEEENGGISFELTYVKNSALFWLFISFFPFFSLSFLLMMVWRKKWEDTIGMSVAICIFILFLMGLSGHLEQGIFLLYIIALVSAIVALVLYNYRKMDIKDICSYGFVFFGISMICILVNCNDLRLARWDEFTHWGLAAKDMFYSNDFAKHAGSTVILKSYPPVATLIEYFFCYTNGLYSDHMVYVGFQVLGVSLLSAGFCIVKEKKQIVPVVLALITLPIIFFYDVTNSIYADPLLAFATAYILICYYSSGKSAFNSFRICAGLFILTLTKDTGVVLAGLLTLVMIGDVLYRQWSEKKFNWKKVILSLCSTVWVCILFFVWQGYLRLPMKSFGGREVSSSLSSGAVSGAIDNSNISVNGIIDLFKGEDGGYRYQSIKNFIIKMFSGETFNFDILKFSFMDISIIILLIALIIGIRKRREEQGKTIISFGAFTFIAGILYCAFLLTTYLFSFSVSEALLISSFERYSGSWICGILISFCILLISFTEKREKYADVFLIALSSFFLVSLPAENLLMLNMDTELTDDMTYGMDELADIVKSGAKETDKVFFICNNSDGYTRYQFRNALVPLLSENGLYNVYESEEHYNIQKQLETQENIIWRDDVQFADYETLQNEILKTEYVVIFHANEIFKESYQGFFEEPEMIDDGTVYRVNKEKEEGFLEYIGKTGIKSFR